MAFSVEMRVAVTLWRLGTDVEYPYLSHLFGVGLSTICVIVSDDVYCNASMRGSKVGSGWLYVKVGSSPACWSY